MKCDKGYVVCNTVNRLKNDLEQWCSITERARRPANTLLLLLLSPSSSPPHLPPSSSPFIFPLLLPPVFASLFFLVLPSCFYYNIQSSHSDFLILIYIKKKHQSQLDITENCNDSTRFPNHFLWISTILVLKMRLYLSPENPVEHKNMNCLVDLFRSINNNR